MRLKIRICSTIEAERVLSHSLKIKGLTCIRLDSDQSMVLTTLDVTGFIAIRPTNLDKNAWFVQRICHM
jgi:hypothetical protein